MGHSVALAPKRHVQVKTMRLQVHIKRTIQDSSFLMLHKNPFDVLTQQNQNVSISFRLSSDWTAQTALPISGFSVPTMNAGNYLLASGHMAFQQDAILRNLGALGAFNCTLQIMAAFPLGMSVCHTERKTLFGRDKMFFQKDTLSFKGLWSLFLPPERNNYFYSSRML